MLAALKPTKRLLWLWAVVCLLTALLTLWPLPATVPVGMVAATLAGSVFVLVMFDALRAPKPGKVTWQRQLPPQLIQGQPVRIELVFRMGIGRYWQKSRRLVVVDRFPEFWHSSQAECVLLTRPGQTARLTYTATPLQRGEASFDGIEYWIPSFMGLWQRRCCVLDRLSVKVLPDFSRILGEQFIGLQRWLQWIGVQPVRRSGLSSTFHQLREYRDGDDIRHIDWKASDRLDRMVVRSYAQEQDNRIVFLLDCGRNMRAISQDFSHFDHALQALLMLAYTALKQGDDVGLHTFAHASSRVVLPQKNLSQMGRLIQGIYDLLPSEYAPDWAQAVSEILQTHKRRSLVVVLTQLQAQDETELAGQLKRLQRHHTVILASLLPADQAHILRQEPTKSPDADNYFAAWNQQQQLAELVRRLSQQNLNVVYASPQQLSSRLINRYLQWRQH